MSEKANLLEGQRQITICNACRYCEGHCGVFKALELRLEFTPPTLDYLANLCHNCGSCYHNCQYSPPHEFKVNIPLALSKIRQDSYSRYTWPAFMGRSFLSNGLLTCLLTVLLVLAGLYLGGLLPIISGHLQQQPSPGSFYAIIPHSLMAGTFSIIGLLVLLAIFFSMVRFWKALGLPNPLGVNRSAIYCAIKDTLSLKHLDGGAAQGCSHASDAPSMARRWLHHFTFYGFMLCFAATTVASFMHYGLALHAPYAYLSAPKILGITGGVGIMIGTIGLLYLKWKIYRQSCHHRKNSGSEKSSLSASKGMDVSFLVLLLLISASGLGLMFSKGTPLLSMVLYLHLSVVLSLFLMMPYGKFIHGFHRFITLVAFAMEQNQRVPIVGQKDNNKIPIIEIPSDISSDRNQIQLGFKQKN